MKHFIIALALILTPVLASASQVINVKVDGLVCDFCARSLEKLFDKQDEVENISVDLNAGLVVVNVKDGNSISDDNLTKLITDSGYNVSNISR